MKNPDSSLQTEGTEKRRKLRKFVLHSICCSQFEIMITQTVALTFIYISVYYTKYVVGTCAVATGQIEANAIAGDEQSNEQKHHNCASDFKIVTEPPLKTFLYGEISIGEALRYCGQKPFRTFYG